MGKTAKKIGILTAGGDCPGLNAAIRGVGKTAIIKYGMDVYGFSSGYLGLINNEYRRLDEKSLSGILTLGGTILGTSREKPFKHKEYDAYVQNKPDRILKNCSSLGLDALICIGGNGTMKTAGKLQELGLNVIGIPKTIDNDVWGTDMTFGFDSAVNIATEAIDRMHTTANSHKRIMVVEVMGHHTGWLTLYSGVAGGGDVILLPELKWKPEILKKYLKKRVNQGKPYSIVVVAEGVKVPGVKKKKERVGAGGAVARLIQDLTGIETRETILGYIQRGGTPSPRDRVIATELGAYAAGLAAEGRYGQMAAYTGNDLCSVPLEEVAGKTKFVPEDHALIRHARTIDTCFGDGA
ncbi:MAG: ATP-dependent 6-phosphofructokinase [Spirochaetales bacterium]|nr:ATP-dependent 6-phosphofructokinase [Spirochaetales bacterium]